MKLLFDRASNGSDEIRNITGFSDADYDFETLKPSLEAATEEVVKIIGRTTYDYLHAKYTDDNGTDNDKELIRKVQSPAAFRGFMFFAPLKDVAVTNEGRTMRMDDHHKAAFQWMIDKHDETLEKTYYRNLDRLIDALDRINPVVKADDGSGSEVKWKDTPEYKDSFDVLFRTTADFDQYFSIESRYLLMKLIPGVRRIQLQELKPRMGDELYKDYFDKLKAGEDVPDAAVLDTMKAACAYLSLAWAVKRMSAMLFPTGIFQMIGSDRQSTKGFKPPEHKEVGVVALSFEEDGRKALVRLEQLLKPAPEPEDPDTPLYDMKIKPCQKFVNL